MNTVIIVDSDSKWIANYKRMLAPFQEELHCLYFQEPDEAVEYLSGHPTEVLVCELDLPVMSGKELFQMADMLSPATVKIAMTKARDLEETLEIFNLGKIYKILLKPFFLAEDLVVPIRAAVKQYWSKAKKEEIGQKAASQLLEMNRQSEELAFKLDEKKHTYNVVLKAAVAVMEANLSSPVAAFGLKEKEAVRGFCAELLREFLQYYMYEKRNFIFYLNYLKNKFHHPGKLRIFQISSKKGGEIPLKVMNRIAYGMFLTGILCQKCQEGYHVENVVEKKENYYILKISYQWKEGDFGMIADSEIRRLFEHLVSGLGRALSDGMEEKVWQQERIVWMYFRGEEEGQ